MIHPIQGCEPFQVTGRPGIFPRKQRGDFALRRGSIRDGGFVFEAGGADEVLGIRDALLIGGDALLESFDAGVASKVIDPLGGYEDIALQMVHEVGKALCDG